MLFRSDGRRGDRERQADTAGGIVGVNTMMQGGLALAVPATAVEAWVRRALAPVSA